MRIFSGIQPTGAKHLGNYSGGFRNAMTFVLVGLDIERKAEMVEQALRAKLNFSSFGICSTAHRDHVPVFGS